MREKCTGPAGWENGHYCKNDDHAGGWVPGQILEWPGNINAEALELHGSRVGRRRKRSRDGCTRIELLGVVHAQPDRRSGRGPIAVLTSAAYA